MAWGMLKDIVLLLAAIGGLGVGWLPLIHRWAAREQLVLLVMLGILTGWLLSWGVYLSGAPYGWFWAGPLMGLSWSWRQRDSIAALWHDSTVRRLLLGWALLSVWCLGWQTLVVTYSGAAWQIDWIEHYDRAQFFLGHWPREWMFFDLYALPARPPLVNLWSAALMSGGGGAFFHHQVWMTLLATLVFFPLGALIERWRDGASRFLLLVLMASPMLVQNATFPWTKLPAAFFVLTAWMLLTPPPGKQPAGRYTTAALALAGGMLAHYSTGPWLCAMAFAWFAVRRGEWTSAENRRDILRGTVLAAALLAVWVGWAVAAYGWDVTFLGNTAAALAPAQSAGERLHTAVVNLTGTLWPFDRPGMDAAVLQQTSPLGQLRDWWFLRYQLRLWWALGSAGGIVLLWLAWKNRATLSQAKFVLITLMGVIVLGTATHAEIDRLGLAHIALQPLVLFVLAWLSAKTDELPRWLLSLWCLGLVLDLALGIAVHFALQSNLLLSELPGLTQAAQSGYASKHNLHLVFLADRIAPGWALGLILVSAVWATWRCILGWPRRTLRS